MKTSELIKKLESLLREHGDKELRFTVTDYYSRYGEEMHTHLKCGEDSNMPSDWSDVMTTGGTTTISFHLKNNYGKYPKITFRK